MNDAQPPVSHPWPDGLVCGFLWSGRPADTASRIRELDDKGVAESAWTSLCASAEQVVAAWQAGNMSAVLAAIRRYATALQVFSTDHGLGIFDAGHDALAHLADSRGIVYKPCGAGGGDIGIALATSDTALSTFCDRAAEYGFRPLSLTLDPCGVSFSGEDER